MISNHRKLLASRDRSSVELGISPLGGRVFTQFEIISLALGLRADRGDLPIEKTRVDSV
jgi:hypothetical protein